MAPVALKIPMLEKFTLPAELLNEECTYELTSCIIHAGGEYGSGGHYTSLQKIDGIWYFFNDSISKMVSKADFKDLLQASYFLVYSKAQDIDPAARRVEADVNQQNIEAAAASKSAAVDQKKSGAENPSATDDRFALEAQQANIEILRDVKDVASHCKNREHFERYLQALPSSVLSLIMKEMDKNISSSPEIIKMMAKDYKKEGRNLLDKDLRILAQVFHKNGGGFGDLDFSGNKELAAIYNDLVVNLYQDPIKMEAIHSIFYHPKFGSIRDQIRAFVYTDAIAAHVSALSQKRIFSQRIEIVDSLLQSFVLKNKPASIKEKPATDIQGSTSAKAPSSQKLEQRKSSAVNFKEIASQLRGKSSSQVLEHLHSLPEHVQHQIQRGLYQAVIAFSKDIQALLREDPVKKGREILNRDILKLNELVRNGDLLRDVLGDSEEIVSSRKEETRDLDNLIALLFSGDSNSAALEKLFYKSSISSQVRDSIRKKVYLIGVCQRISEEVIRILSDERHLEDRAIKQLLISTIESCK